MQSPKAFNNQLIILKNQTTDEISKLFYSYCVSDFCKRLF